MFSLISFAERNCIALSVSSEEKEQIPFELEKREEWKLQLLLSFSYKESSNLKLSLLQPWACTSLQPGFHQQRHQLMSVPEHTVILL